MDGRMNIFCSMKMHRLTKWEKSANNLTLFHWNPVDRVVILGAPGFLLKLSTNAALYNWKLPAS